MWLRFYKWTPVTVVNCGSNTMHPCPESTTSPSSELFRVNHFIRLNLSPMDILTDAAILYKFPLQRQQIHQLLNLIRPTLARPTRLNFTLTPEVQLLAALRFYALGSFIEVVGDGLDLSEASVWRCVHACGQQRLFCATLGISSEYLPLARRSRRCTRASMRSLEFRGS